MSNGPAGVTNTLLTCLTTSVIIKLPPRSYSQPEMIEMSVKRYTVQPVTAGEQCQVQGSSTYIIKARFDLAPRKTPHLAEMNQTVEEAGGSRRSTGGAQEEHRRSTGGAQEEHRFTLH